MFKKSKSSGINLFVISLGLVLLGAGCTNTVVKPSSPEPIVTSTQPPTVSDKPYYPENQVAAATGEVFIKREHFSGMQHCADVIHVFQGKTELFNAELADCNPVKDSSDSSGQNFIYRYNFTTAKASPPTMFTFVSKTDPAFTILDDKNKPHPNQVWFQVNEKIIVFDEVNKIFTEDKEMATVSNIFTLGVAPNQKYGTMTVTTVNSNTKDPISNDNIRVEFAGTTRLVGTLVQEAGMGPEYSINSLTSESLKKLPYLQGDKRSVWFGARNPEIIKAAHLKNGDKVQLVINKYYYTLLPAEAWNEAEIVSIEKIK